MGRRAGQIAATVVATSVLAGSAATAANAPPRLKTATVIGERINLTFDAPLDPTKGAWTVMSNGRPVTAKHVDVSGRRVQLTLPEPVYGDDVVRVVGRYLRAHSGARMRIVDVKPRNRSTAGCSEQLGTAVQGQATEGPTHRATFIKANPFKLFVVRVDFADAPLRSRLPIDFAAVADWIRVLSYGRASIQTWPWPGTVRMPRKFVEYTHSGPWDARKPFFEDLIREVDDRVDFDNVSAIVVAMPARLASGAPAPTIEPLVLTPSGIPVDGRELRHLAVASDSVSAMTALLRLAGLPALTGGYATGWDPMAGVEPVARLGLLAWHRRKLGWLTHADVRCLRTAPLELTLEPTWRHGGVKAVIVPINRTTAVVLENRQRQGLDLGHCSKGILAYEVRTDWPHHLRVLPADPAADPACAHGLPRAPYDLTPNASARVHDAVTFEVLSIEPDGSYRLRLRR